ncbi:MAG: hypothetical protein RL434_3095 [Pseudomonadota bacterium]|jgi:4-amino-4-deoxy-L-arabinose transferase-like glycosyltransferase
MNLPPRNAGLQALAPWLVIVTFLFSMVWLLIWPDPFSFGLDEGFNLMKAFLMPRGERLFVDIWSDQPPVFAWLLRGMFAIFGASVTMGRLTTLLCAGLLLLAAHDLLRQSTDHFGALLAILCVVLLAPGFLLWSGAVLIGLPAIAFALASVACLVRWHDSGAVVWLLASAVLLAVSACTKFFTLILVPCVLPGLLILPLPGAQHRWRAVLAWCAGFGVILLLVLGLTDALFHPEQLFGNHWEAKSVPVYAHLSHTAWLAGQPRCWLLYGLALSALRPRLWRTRPLVFYCGTWMVAALLTLHFHRPFWSHHALLPAIPAAPLAAVTLWGWSQRWLKDAHRARLMLAVLLVSLVVIPMAVAKTARQFAGQHWKWEMLELLRARTTRNTTMITDDPIIAFRAGVPVDPHLAVFSNKRRISGLLDESMVEKRLRLSRPDFVLFGSHTLQGLPGLTAILTRHYRPLHRAGRLHLHERIPIP